MTYRQTITNEDGEPLGIETVYEQDPNDWADDWDRGGYTVDEYNVHGNEVGCCPPDGCCNPGCCDQPETCYKEEE